jgi:uncharacterized protein YbjT (DUF2867 family)
MSSPILVIGALGNVGAEVVRELLNKNVSVRAADMDVEKVKARFGNAVQAVRFDFADASTFPDTFNGVKKIFLLRPPQISDVKRIMFPAIDAAKQAGVKQVVFLSLIGIENAKFVPHYKVEQYLTACGFNTTFLRCSFFMQNLNTVHRQEIRERNEIFVPVGNAKTSFIDARDIGAVTATVLTQAGHKNKNYDLTGSEALDYWQASNIMSNVLGKAITYRNPNPLQFFIETMRRGTPFAFAVVMMGLYTSTRFGMAEPVTDEVENLIGRKPITFQQYVMDYKESWS